MRIVILKSLDGSSYDRGQPGCFSVVSKQFPIWVIGSVTVSLQRISISISPSFTTDYMKQNQGEKSDQKGINCYSNKNFNWTVIDGQEGWKMRPGDETLKSRRSSAKSGDKRGPFRDNTGAFPLVVFCRMPVPHSSYLTPVLVHSTARLTALHQSRDLPL